MESLLRETSLPPAIPGGPTRADRWALRSLQLGALLVVLVAATDRTLDLDRFFVPKEAVLHLTALVAGLLAAGAFRRVALTPVDLLLAAYLFLGLFSSLLAQDGERALRGLAISVSGVAVFWAARGLREAGLARPLVRILALAVVLAAATSLLQAYGVGSDFFSLNRVPGGTLGNRNFVAHMAAFGLPLVLLAALRAWRTAGYALGTAGSAIVVMSLVLTRSRAGWLAFGAVILVLGAGMILSRPLWRHGRTRWRLAGVVGLLGVGVAAAVLVPNALRWRSENPYLESVAGLANFQEGSGRGRLVQYGRTLRMAMDRPLLGVGPGNWAREYPAYAAPGDPSLSRSAPGTTANPWPSSDWVAFVAERGFPATLLLAAAMAGIAGSAVRRLLRARDEDEAIVAAALLAMLLATLVAGAFDAVLLLAHPTLLVWAALGALWSPGSVPPPVDSPRAGLGVVLLVAVALAAGVGLVRSVERLSTMTIYGVSETPPDSADPVYSIRELAGYSGGAQHVAIAARSRPRPRLVDVAAEGSSGAIRAGPDPRSRGATTVGASPRGAVV